MQTVKLSEVAKMLVGMKHRSGRRYIDVYVATPFAPSEVIRTVTNSGDKIGIVLFDCRADQIQPNVVHFSGKVG